SAVFIVSIIPHSADIDIDSPSYYTAAKGIQKGINIYEEERFQSLADQTFGRSMIVWPFIYPPLTAQIFIPLTLLNPLDYSRALLLINILATFLCVFLLADLLKLGSHPSGLPLLFLFSMLLFNFPLYRTLEFGQLNMWVMASVLLSLRLDKKDRPFLSSFFLMLAVFFKIFPAVFLVFYLLQKRFRYVLFAVFNGIGMLLISVVVSGLSHWINYVRILFKSFILGEKPLYFFDFTAFLNNNSLKAFFTQLLQHFNMPRSSASLLVILFLAGSIILVRKKIRSFIQIRDQNFYMSVLITLPLLLSSMSWQHHFVSLIVPFLFMFSLIVEKRTYSLLIPFLMMYAAVSYFPPYGGFPFNHVRLFATVLCLPLLYRIYFTNSKKELRKKELFNAV
ncbi:MAG: glycosyltransferase family 87 protein, partial [Acidobacteriota bacterium]